MSSLPLPPDGVRTAVASLIDRYRPLPGTLDEMLDPQGGVRSHWLHFLESLAGLGDGEPRHQLGGDAMVAEQEGRLVEALAAHPAGDLVVALAGVARATRRDDVVEGVATAPREREHAVALERAIGRAAVGATAPRLQQGEPLVVAQVVLDPRHASLPTTGVPGPAAAVGRHHRDSR